MRARNWRDRRARRGHYALRDLAGFADIECLLATDITGEQLSPDADDDDPADAAAELPMSETEKTKAEKPETRPTDDGYVSPPPSKKKIIEPEVSRASHYS
jgi:hypothetical protein